MCLGGREEEEEGEGNFPTTYATYNILKRVGCALQPRFTTPQVYILYEHLAGRTLSPPAITFPTCPSAIGRFQEVWSNLPRGGSLPNLLSRIYSVQWRILDFSFRVNFNLFVLAILCLSKKSRVNVFSVNSDNLNRSFTFQYREETRDHLRNIRLSSGEKNDLDKLSLIEEERASFYSFFLRGRMR